jgi:hypothetical protein
MGVGELWWFDKHALHSAVNAGITDRIHLIMDVYRRPGGGDFRELSSW